MKNFNLDAILEAMLKMSDRVSDLNFSVGRQPQVEVDGQLVPVNFPGLPRLSPYQTEMIAMHMLRGDGSPRAPSQETDRSTSRTPSRGRNEFG